MRRIRKGRMIGVLSVFIFSVLLLTGCGDMVEIQDRDFVLALGIAYEDQQYRVTYGLPDLGKATDQESASDQSSLLRIYRGNSLSEIEQAYNFNSENRLDYRHLQVILLEASICSEPEAMEMLLTELNDNYNISHNVLVYYYAADVSELMGTGGVHGSIGEHLNKLNQNNRVHGTDPVKIGSLIDCLSNERTLFIPALDYRDNSIAVNGGIFFRENQMVRAISQADSDFYFITLGKSKDVLFRLSPDHLVQLKEIKTKTRYALTEQGPVIRLDISGTAKSLPEHNRVSVYPKEQMNALIRQRIEAELAELMMGEGIDYLNFYEKSSYKNREMWLQYEGRLDEFVEDARLLIAVDIHYE